MVMVVPATIKDIARDTSLSTATISKYLSGIAVKPENADRISKSIKNLNYQVNAIARGLKTNKTMTIGVILPNLSDIFSTDIIVSIEDHFSKHGYSVLICDCGQSGVVMLEKLDLLLSRRVDGLIVFPLLDEPRLPEKLRAIDIPIVFIDQKVESVERDCVLVDNVNAAFKVTQNLISNGHKDIAIICGPEFNYTSIQRFNGYKNALEANEIKIDPGLIAYGDYSTQSGYDLFVQLWKSDRRPTAVFASSYYITLGAVLAIQDLGLKIGEDISLFAFDNIDLAKVVTPALSVVVQPQKKMGEIAFDLLVNRLNGNRCDPPEEIILPTEIILQESVASLL